MRGSAHAFAMRLTLSELSPCDSTCTLACLSLLPVSAVCPGQRRKSARSRSSKLERKDPVTYEKDVEPIFYKRCTVCHSRQRQGRQVRHHHLRRHDQGGQTRRSDQAGQVGRQHPLQGRWPARSKPFMPPRGEEPLHARGSWPSSSCGSIKAPRPRPACAKRPKPSSASPPASVKPVRALAVSPDKIAVAAGRGNQIHIYDAGSGRLHPHARLRPGLKSFDGKAVKAAHLSIVESMAWSPDGKYLVSGSFQEIAIWDALTGEQRHKITGFAHNVVAIAFSSTASSSAPPAATRPSKAKSRSSRSAPGSSSSNIKNGHSDTVYGLAFSPEVQIPEPAKRRPIPRTRIRPSSRRTPMFMLATGSADKFVKVWNLADGKFVKSFEGHTHHVLDVGWIGRRQAARLRRRRQHRQGLGLRKGRTGPHHQRPRQAGDAPRSSSARRRSSSPAAAITQVKVFNATNGGNVRTFAGGTDFIYAIARQPRRRPRRRRRPGRHRPRLQRRHAALLALAAAAGRAAADARKRRRSKEMTSRTVLARSASEDWSSPSLARRADFGDFSNFVPLRCVVLALKQRTSSPSTS